MSQSNVINFHIMTHHCSLSVLIWSQIVLLFCVLPHLIQATDPINLLLTYDDRIETVSNQVPNHVSNQSQNQQTLTDEPALIGATDYLQRLDVLFYFNKKTFKINVVKAFSEQNKITYPLPLDISAVDTLACDWLTRKLYWVDSDLNRLEVSDLDGGNRTVLMSKGMEFISTIALAPLDSIMFLAHWGHAKLIESISMDGDTTTKRPLVEDTVALTIAVDHSSRRLFWIDNNVNNLKQIMSVSFNGANKQTIKSNFNLIDPSALMFAYNHLYLFDHLQILRINLTLATSHVQDSQFILQTNKHPHAVKHMYLQQTNNQPYVHHACEINNGNCSNLCLLSTHKPYRTCKCPTGFKLMSDGLKCDSILNDFLLVISKENIHLISLETSPFTLKKVKLGNLKKVNFIDWDPISRRIFWTDEVQKTINSADLDGSGREIILYAEDAVLQNIAVDFFNQNIYFVNMARKHIEVVRTDGTSRSVMVSDDIDRPRGLAVNPLEGYFYWTDWGAKAKIEKVSLDGIKRIVLINEGLGWPNDITIDHQAKRIYWCDAKLHKIEYALLDGSKRKQLIVSPMALAHPFSLTIVNEYVYWTDWVRKTVSRAKKSNGGPEVVANVEKVMGLNRVSSTDYFKEYESRCTNNNGGCSHLCFDFIDSDIQCGCPTGMVLNDAEKTCTLGSNPCLDHNGNCSDYCEHKFGNFRLCKCESNQFLDIDHRTCVDKSKLSNSTSSENDDPSCQSANCSDHVMDTACAGNQSICLNKCLNHHHAGVNCTHLSEAACVNSTADCAPACAPDQVKCVSDHKCIRQTDICNGVSDCPDASDEACCSPHQFVCRHDLHHCLSIHSVCDAKHDCADGSDESDARHCAVQRNLISKHDPFNGQPVTVGPSAVPFNYHLLFGLLAIISVLVYLTFLLMRFVRANKCHLAYMCDKPYTKPPTDLSVTLSTNTTSTTTTTTTTGMDINTGTDGTTATATTKLMVACPSSSSDAYVGQCDYTVDPNRVPKSISGAENSDYDYCSSLAESELNFVVCDPYLNGMPAYDRSCLTGASRSHCSNTASITNPPPTPINHLSDNVIMCPSSVCKADQSPCPPPPPSPFSHLGSDLVSNCPYLDTTRAHRTGHIAPSCTTGHHPIINGGHNISNNIGNNNHTVANNNHKGITTTNTSMAATGVTDHNYGRAHSPPSSAFTINSYPFIQVPPPSPVTERSYGKFI